VDNPYKGGKTLAEIKSQSQKMYKLSSNENPIGASPKAIAAVQAAAHDLHRYPDRTDARLRTALAEYYKNELKEDQFVVANSGSETLELIIRGFMSEGHECIISNPTFLVYQMFAKWQGATIHNVPLLAPDFKVDVESILAKINNNTRLVFLTSPNNPTGSYIPKAVLDDLIDRLPSHIILVLDEVYWHFADASLEAGIAALGDSEFIKATVELVQTERTYMQTELEKIGVHYWPSQGNFILTKPPIAEKEFESRMLDQGVMVRPVSAFGAPGCVRITLGDREANDACLEALRVLYKEF